MAKLLTKKSGILQRHRDQDRKMLRDRAIFAELMQRKRESEKLHDAFSMPITPFSLYLPQTSPTFNDALTAFPMTARPDGRPMPDWPDLTPWLQMQVTLMAMEQYGTLTVDIHIHQEIVDRCLATGLDMHVYIRDRVRKELQDHSDIDEKLDYFFVIEGNRSKINRWTGTPQSVKTKPHIHGAVVLLDDTDPTAVTEAVARACGQTIGNRGQTPRSVHSKLYEDRGGAYVDYILKYRKSRDSRLPERRHTFSNGAIGGGKLFWEGLTGKWPGFTTMPYLVFTGQPGHC